MAYREYALEDMMDRQVGGQFKVHRGGQGVGGYEGRGQPRVCEEGQIRILDGGQLRTERLCGRAHHVASIRELEDWLEGAHVGMISGPGYGPQRGGGGHSLGDKIIELRVVL